MLLFLLSLASAEPPPAPTPFQCCDDPHLQRIVDRYARWTDAISEDPSNHARHVYALIPLLTPSPTSSDDDKAVIARVRHHASQARDLRIPAVLPLWETISHDLVYLALRHEGGDLTLTEAACSSRGSWLQRGLSNPLDPYGDGCGQWR